MPEAGAAAQCLKIEDPTAALPTFKCYESAGGPTRGLGQLVMYMAKCRKISSILIFQAKKVFSVCTINFAAVSFLATLTENVSVECAHMDLCKNRGSPHRGRETNLPRFIINKISEMDTI